MPFLKNILFLVSVEVDTSGVSSDLGQTETSGVSERIITDTTLLLQQEREGGMERWQTERKISQC